MANYTDYESGIETHTFECDYCYNNTEHEGDFFDALCELKLDSWKVIKEGSVWLHLCSENCAAENKKENLFKKLK